ncbi:protein phosphatase 2C domain-containing protein [Candidatus Micrarchaeota archaeon]|nr:protein phosphatase 2C domain-containing protein [Candidatus Micrarchaeota archaeon]
MAGRQGIFFDSNALPAPLFERLGAPQIPQDSRKKRLSEQAGEPGTASLCARAKRIILRILQKSGDCGRAELREFLEMHPGVRSLRFRNYESSLVTDGNWKQALGNLVSQGKRLPSGFERADLIADEINAIRTQFGSICFDLNIEPPTQGEMVEALMRPGELARSQAAFFRKAAAEDGVLQKELDDFKSWASGLSPEDLRHAWRRMAPNLATVASLAHALRFRRAPAGAFSDDESHLLHKLLGKPEFDAGGLRSLESAFSNDVCLCGDLVQTIFKIIGEPEDAVLEAARASMEFDTLLDFSRIPREHVLARISKSPGFTKKHSGTGAEHPDNDDALTSLSMMIRHSGGTRFVDLDVVFDGVSGHGGASIASRIAKDVFEIAALAGWVRSPEDVRFAALMADFAIDIEKERLRILAQSASGTDKERLEGMQNMGTTFAASYIEGNRFYGIHCGDSDYLVVRDGAVVSRSNPHGIGNTIWAGLGIGTRSIDINNKDSGFEAAELREGDAVLTLTDGVGDVMCDHEYGPLAARNKGNSLSLTAEIMGSADSRKDPSSLYKPACGCLEKSGKDDDMTLIARYVKPQ